MKMSEAKKQSLAKKAVIRRMQLRQGRIRGKKKHGIKRKR